MDAETLARLKLHLLPGLGPKTLAALLERFETAERILRTPASELMTIPNIGQKTAEQLTDAIPKLNVDAELALVEKHQATMLHMNHADYPAALRAIPTAPFFLFHRGTFVPADSKSVAIVGSRHCTAYGRRIATRLAAGLAAAGWTVVSGLARGIDGVAHTAALDAGGRTIAVLAGGLGKLYPPEHKELAERVVQQGVLLSEMPMAMAPMPDLFPRRNRIISGLSRATIIVEAALKSGALITARLAGEQGREVLAVPGPVDSEASEGPHLLIRNGATLVRSVEDVLEALDALPVIEKTDEGVIIRKEPVRAENRVKEPPATLSPAQLQLWQAIGSESASVDDLIASTGLGISETNSGLLMMELAGHVRRQPGNRFARK
ncbi:MAG TPA: DNA-processing protein DprA [Gemmatales bacterium]|nr:DNA-processing protein DprA [Gemmatales bacterium]